MTSPLPLISQKSPLRSSTPQDNEVPRECYICGKKLNVNNKKTYCSKHYKDKCRCGNEKVIYAQRCRSCFTKMKGRSLSKSKNTYIYK